MHGRESVPNPQKIDPEGLKLSNQLCFATYAAALAFNRVYKPLLDPHGLTYPQYLVLLVLWEQDDVSLKTIGERLHLDSGTLTPLLKRLQTAGLIERKRHAGDERQIRVTLTTKGRELKEPIAAARHQVACSTGLEAKEIKALKEEIDRLAAQLVAA
jgi:DNA-binding MarR family transcriptional regulator